MLLYIYLKILNRTDLLVHALRSSSRNLLTFPSNNTSNYGDRVFSFAAAKLWNSLPDHIRCIDTLISFKSSLKTFLFRQAKTPPR